MLRFDPISRTIPHIVGSTEGKRRFQELRREMADKNRFQVRKFHWGYRIKRIEQPAQLKMALSEV